MAVMGPGVVVTGIRLHFVRGVKRVVRVSGTHYSYRLFRNHADLKCVCAWEFDGNVLVPFPRHQIIQRITS